MRHSSRLGFGLLAGLCMAPGSALAAEPRAASREVQLGDSSDVVSVRARQRDAFQPDGIRIGNYVLFSEVGFRAGWTADSAQTTRTGDHSRFQVAPDFAFELHSQFQRHQLDFKVEGRPIGLDDGEVRAIDGQIKTNWRIAIDHANSFYGSAAMSIRHEEDLADERPGGVGSRSSITKSNVEAGYALRTGRIDAAIGARYQRWDFSDVALGDGTQISHDAHDYGLLQPFVQLGYRLSPGYKVFASVGGRWQDNRGDGVIDRDARGSEAHAGVELELSPVMRLMLKAGYVAQDYLQPGLIDIGALVWQGRLEWLVTPLLTVSLGSQRDVTSTGYGTASGRLVTAHSLRADYEMWRNLLLSAEASVRTVDYFGENRDDTILVGSLGAEYMAGKHWRLTLGYEHQQLTSNLSDLDRSIDKISLGVKYRY